MGTLNGIYQKQADFSLTHVSLVARYKWLLVGVALSNAVTGLVGYYNRNFVLGYSLDYYYKFALGTAHKISLKYFFKMKKKK